MEPVAVAENRDGGLLPANGFVLASSARGGHKIHMIHPTNIPHDPGRVSRRPLLLGSFGFSRFLSPQAVTQPPPAAAMHEL